MTVDTAAGKLTALRKLMKEQKLDVYIIPTDDPHLSEYVPDAYKRRAYLTGFGGSAGTAVVFDESSYVWTDSRYWNEAGLQLDADCWTLQKAGLPDTPTIPKFLTKKAVSHYQNTRTAFRIGLDGYVHPASFADELNELMETAQKEEGLDNLPAELVPVEFNLVDQIWENRPAIPANPFRVHKYAGKTIADKLTDVRQAMEEKKAKHVLLSALDDVNYLFNIRAKGDIDTCPVGISYAVVSESSAVLYCNEAKITDEVQSHLADVTIKPYEDVAADIQTAVANSEKVWVDKSKSNWALANLVPETLLIDAQNPIVGMKAVKNKVEMENMREAHIVDGVAMAHFMAWLSQEIQTRKISEVEIDEVLTNYRAQQPGFVECSFPTIAGVGSNGAIIHYRADHNDLLKYLDLESPILIDSGAQYEYGTTDVTRTWSFQSNVSDEYKSYYTRVLKGNIGMDVMQFPDNTPGFVLDVYARRWLWDIGVDYGHGTGHGVGAALNVHEGPQSISPRWANKQGLKAGMVVSNEPGYYEDGNFGIRIENLIEIQYANDEHQKKFEANEEITVPQGKKKFLKFAKLTMIPIQKNLIDVSLMTPEELDWLDNYHAKVLEKVGSRLEDGSPAKAWLEAACAKIDRA